MRRPRGQSSAWSRGVARGGVVLLAAIFAPALAGCLLSTEKPDAGLDIPDNYRFATRNAEALLPSTVWWRGFRSKELSDLIEESLTSNLDIAAAVARIVQADAQSRISGAALLPAVTLNGSATRSRPSQATGSIQTSTTGRSERITYSASLSASYEIDFWGKNRAALRAAEETAAATRFDREVVALSTVVSVANAYFQVLASQDRLRVARRNLAAAQRVYRLIDERFKAGTASALDTAQQESLLNTQRASIPPLVLTLQQNIATLAVLIGRPPERVKVRGGSMNQLSFPRIAAGLPSELLTQRPDIREAEAQLAAANANVYAARAALLPSITLTGEGGTQSRVLKSLLSPQSLFYNIAGGLTQPIFEGGRLLGALDQQKGRQDELLQLYRKAVVNGFADVDRALSGVQQNTARERLQRDVVTSSRRAFDIAETRLRAGAVDLVTVLNTQQTLFQAEDTLAQARLARLQAFVSLYQALGGGWQKPPEGPPPPPSNSP
jgi:NodT family efflux transporter outer membrane factor (OMF) lipoprotein